MSENSREFPEKNPKNSQFLSDAGVSFLQVPYALFKLRTHFGFSPTESYLAIFLFEVSHWGKSYEFSKSYSEIAKTSGLSKRKVIDCITRMIREGILTAKIRGNRQNIYTWNEGFLRFGGANGSPQEVKSVHLKGENGSPLEVKTVHHIYIVFFKEVFIDSHKEFFLEEGAGYFVRIPPKKKSKSEKDKKDAEDSAPIPTKRFISRRDAWNLAIDAVLAKKGTDVAVNLYIALKSKFDPNKAMFPKKYLETMHSDKATQWQFKKEHGFPLHLESDESFFEYLKSDDEFRKFQQKRGH